MVDDAEIGQFSSSIFSPIKTSKELSLDDGSATRKHVLGVTHVLKRRSGGEAA